MPDQERLIAELRAQSEESERRHRELLDELRAARGPRSKAERMVEARRKMSSDREDPMELARERREQGRHKGGGR